MSPVLVCPNAEAALDRAAALFAEKARAAAVERGRFAVALAGGRTPLGLYRRLAGAAYDGLPWRDTELFWSDERCVPPEHPRSNYGAAGPAMASRVPPGRVHRIPGERGPEDAAAAYDAALVRVLGSEPRLDLVLLGLGEDGHTASLFPGSPALEASSWAAPVPAADGREARVTLTYPCLALARSAVFLVLGADKAGALRRALAGEGPAGKVRAGERTWVADEPAAGSAAREGRA